MSKEKKNTMTPRLRFPEFREAGEWEEKTLEEVGEVLMCKRIFSEETNDKEGVPFYKIGTLGGNPDAYISKKLFEEYKSKYKYPRKGEILITCSGTVGKCLTYNGEEAYYQDSNIVWIDNPSLEIKNELLFYMLSNVNWGKLNSTTITRIYGSDLRNLTIVFPKSPIEQQKIAATLTSLNDLIAAQSEKIKALQTHKKGLMQQLFPVEGEMVPRVRFGEFEGAGKWEIKHISQLLRIGNGQDYKHLSKGDIPVYGSGGYMLSVDGYLYEGESVCIGRKGTINKPMFLTGKFWIVDTLFYTHSFKDCLPKFIYLIFQNINWLDHNEAGGIPSLSKTNIEKIKVFIPALPEQQKITATLTSLDDLITAQSNKLEALKAHKKGLMQQLFPNPNEA